MGNEIGSALMAAGFARVMICAGPAPDTLQVGVQWPGQRRYTFISGHAGDPPDRWRKMALAKCPSPGATTSGRTSRIRGWRPSGAGTTAGPGAISREPNAQPAP